MHRIWTLTGAMTGSQGPAFVVLSIIDIWFLASSSGTLPLATAAMIDANEPLEGRPHIVDDGRIGRHAQRGVGCGAVDERLVGHDVRMSALLDFDPSSVSRRQRLALRRRGRGKWCGGSRRRLRRRRPGPLL